jgi:2-octaprenyl-6-methoxyphenol hydroxylase
MSARDCDIAIVGGGLVGASLACALAPLGYRISLVEAVAPRAAAEPVPDGRSLALSLASCRILEGLGLWPALHVQATPIVDIRVCEQDRPGRVHLRAAELGLAAFGHVVEARVLGAVLMQHLAGLERVQLQCPAQVTAWRADDTQAHLQLQVSQGEQSLAAALVVAADGASSAMRGLAGIAAHTKDYGQSAVVCTVTPRQPLAGCAYERMTRTGPIALLPHGDGRCGLVWCERHDMASELLALTDGQFLQRVNDLLGGAPGPLARPGRRSLYPLQLVVPETDRFTRGLLIGNAAHTIHPAGAQGFNLGLRDVAALAEVLSDAGPPGAGTDPGCATVLQAYSDWRRPDREATVAWTDGLVGLFASPLALSSAVRGLGMMAHAVFPSLRRRLACRAMGYRGRTPVLAMGQRLYPPAGSKQ